MIKSIENMLGNSRLRCILGVFMACMLAVSIFPYSFAAYGVPENAQKSADVDDVLSVATAAAKDEASDSGKSGTASSTENGSAANPSDIVNGTNSVAKSAARDNTTPTWVQAGNGATVEYDPDDPLSATVTGTAAEGGTISVNLTAGENLEYTLTINGGTVIGDIEVPTNTKLNLKGNGTLKGTGAGSVIVVYGDGADLTVGDIKDAEKVAGTDCLTITGGIGSTLKVEDIIGEEATAGGAILVERENAGDVATLTINNVEITGNDAQGGGGIYVDRECAFTMKNGLITSNKTQARETGSGDRRAHEGGGIVVAGSSRIYKGVITSNSTSTTTDWGGGGIFIESQGSVYFGDDTSSTSVLITGNTAAGLGGGISGCPHARAGIGPIGGEQNAIAIYGNTAGNAEKGVAEYLSHDDNWALWKYGDKGDYLFFNQEGEDGTYTAPDNLIAGAQDFYCTYASAVGPLDFPTEQGYSWTGNFISKNAPSTVNDITISKGDAPISIIDASVGLTAGTPTARYRSGDEEKVGFPPDKFDVVIMDNESTTHGGGIGCNGVVGIGHVPNEDVISPNWRVEFTKQFTSLNGESVLEPEQFNFGLYTDVACTEESKIASATNDANGTIRFLVDDEKYLPAAGAEPQTYPFYVKEIVSNRSDRIEYDERVRKIEVTLSRVETTSESDNHYQSPWEFTSIFLHVDSVKYFVQNDAGDGFVDDEAVGSTFSNVFTPHGTFTMTANKAYYGDDVADASDRFAFTMQRIDEPAGNKIDASSYEKHSTERYSVKNSAFTDNIAPITFEGVDLGAAGDYWYMITEEEAEGSSTDPRVYVVKANASISDDGQKLDTRVTEVYYAERFDEQGTTLTRLNNDEDGNVPEIEFVNFGTKMQSARLYGYAVNAASNEPIEQKCYVDPKIIKNLEGRTLAEGEFNFKLIRLVPGADGLVDWNVTQGTVISETTNDRYGMVDFDAANPQNNDWENPSCLVYEAPGTYSYRVVEANETTDPSVDYSKQIITFTTVIERDEQGQLICTDMYYGHVENGENLRYTESEDPQWHPTMTNYAKGMDLKVRKTSALDRENGLEGATYGLYAVNDGAQADIFLGEATSDAAGWITFEDVVLKEGTLYYFKERLAPAGHTVSEFRSGFFYLVKDNSAPNGYAMRYTDSKFEPASAQEGIVLFALEGDDDATGLPDDQAGISLLALDGDDDASAASVSENGNMLFTYARDGGVYDEATLVEFNKLDTRTHEWVEGAELAIIDKASGATVNEWVSGSAPERLEGTLNVDTTYILRELSAPEGYAKAGDVEFVIGQYGAVSILSGADNGNAEIQDSTITLYDTMFDEENTVIEYREKTADKGSSPNGGLPVRTGDLLKFGGVLLLAVLAIMGMILFSRKRYKPQHSRKR